MKPFTKAVTKTCLVSSGDVSVCLYACFHVLVVYVHYVHVLTKIYYLVFFYSVNETMTPTVLERYHRAPFY